MDTALEKYRDSQRYLDLAAKNVEQAKDMLRKEYEAARAEAEQNSFTQQEAADVIGCHRRTVARKLESGELASLKINHVLEYKRNQ